MKRKIGINILIIGLYCFPYVYFSMYKDFNNSSMVGYLIMIFITSILAFASKYSNNLLSMIVGNIISLVMSYYFIKGMSGNDRWDGYFKPFYPTHFLFFASLINLGFQILSISITSKLRILKNKK